eukprot:GHRR01033893.1.p1 GENE.GHRR01033893.1~~GHRR01033893.1.p1  ORF type:complete len:118 (-),score=8.63 GHRR01033893.1:658-1011(-)
MPRTCNHWKSLLSLPSLLSGHLAAFDHQWQSVFWVIPKSWLPCSVVVSGEVIVAGQQGQEHFHFSHGKTSTKTVPNTSAKGHEVSWLGTLGGEKPLRGESERVKRTCLVGPARVFVC